MQTAYVQPTAYVQRVLADLKSCTYAVEIQKILGEIANSKPTITRNHSSLVGCKNN